MFSCLSRDSTLNGDMRAQLFIPNKVHMFCPSPFSEKCFFVPE